MSNMIFVALMATLLLLSAGNPTYANAGERQMLQNNHILIGVVRGTSLDGYCGANLQFSKDYQKHHGKNALVQSGKKALMHLDGRDVDLQLVSRSRQENAKHYTVSERLHLKSLDYRVDIKWFVFDLCDKEHNEDCEIEGLRAYITIHRANHSSHHNSQDNSVRHARLFGVNGC